MFFPFQHNEDTHAGVSPVCQTWTCVGHGHVRGFELSVLDKVFICVNLCQFKVVMLLNVKFNKQ